MKNGLGFAKIIYNSSEISIWRKYVYKECNDKGGEKESVIKKKIVNSQPYVDRLVFCSNVSLCSPLWF